MMKVRGPGSYLAILVLFGAQVAAAFEPTPLHLARGARIGVVSSLEPDITHFHSGRSLKDAFLHTERLNWSTGAMLLDALKERVAQMGLVLVPMGVTTELSRARETCFLNGNFNKGLPKDCVPAFEHLGSEDQVQAVIVLAPGLNNSAHAGSSRRKELPDYVRGWGFMTGTAGAPDGKPALFSMTELLLVAPSPDGPALHAREWGGNYELEWASFVPPPDLKAIPIPAYGELKPLFAGLLGRQTSRLLDQIQIGP
jgi:hypothetical protein